MGFFGLGTCAMAVIGIWLGIKGFREREKIYTTCKVGITVMRYFSPLWWIIRQGLM